MRIFASRQYADYVRASYAGAGEARMAHVGLGEAVWIDLGIATLADWLKNHWPKRPSKH